MKKEEIVKKYDEIARKNLSCLKECCPPETSLSLLRKYYQNLTDEFPEEFPEISDLSLGCGNPILFSEIKEGLTVLDIGSGRGLDVFIAAKKVRDTGKVIGLDLSKEMIKKATNNAKKLKINNVEFKHGDMENMPIESNSVDTIISNCVINLATDKEKVFREAYRVLKKGGKIVVSDIVTEKPVPDHIREDLNLWISCIAGALPENEYLETIKKAGFSEIQILEKIKLFSIEKFSLDGYSITVKAQK